MKLSLLLQSGLIATLLLVGCATQFTTPVPAEKITPEPVVIPTPAAAPLPTPNKVSFTTDVYFNVGKSNLNKKAIAELDEVIAKMQYLKLEVIYAVAHTSNSNSNVDEEMQSLDRADAVKAYLLSKGVPPDKVYTESKDDLPAMAINTAIGRAKYRRVEIEVVGYPIKKSPSKSLTQPARERAD